MGLSVGIVGLPNVGKSTAFNALTKAQNATAANYPFCTIEPNKAIVPVPDDRLQQLADIVSPERILPATVEFVDIAGLVKGASKGEGLGNQFLSNIKECAAILHMVRCFEDDDITHVEGDINPIRDIDIINTELICSDIQMIERKIEKLNKQAKVDKVAKALLDMAKKLYDHLDGLQPISLFADRVHPHFETLERELRFLSNKPTIFVANVSEEAFNEENDHIKALQSFAKAIDAPVIKLCAAIEEEIIALDEEEAAEFLQSLDIQKSGLDRVITTAFDKLELMNYFTAGVKEVRAWTIPKNTLAPKAAGVIHNDFEKGFIKAEVISFEDYIRCQGESKAKESGLLRLEGKAYIVQDGDVMHFKFNV